MSDDDDEGCLQIDESPSDTEEKPSIIPECPIPSSSSSVACAPEPVRDQSGKEDGEIDDEDEEEDENKKEDEPMDTDDQEKPLEIVEEPEEPEKRIEIPKSPKQEIKVEELIKIEEPVIEPPSSSTQDVKKEPEMEKDDAPEVQKIEKEVALPVTPPPVEKPQGTPSKKENGLMKPPQSTEKGQGSSRKRKESSDNYSAEKRKSGLETIAASSESTSTTPQRSKRSSSQMAKWAITECLAAQDIVPLPAMPIQKTPETSSQPKRPKRDVGTNVITTKATDTSSLLSNESIMETPPGSQLMLEVTVMYRTKNSLAFRVKGCDLIGFLGDGLPPMASSLANNNATGNNNNKKKSNNDDAKDGRSSSASSNGRSTRGGSVAKEGNSKSDKGKSKRKKDDTNDDEMDEENQNNEQYGSRKYKLVEIDSSKMHDCHYDGCEKRFDKSTELEYHIAKNHKKRVMMYEAISTQTDSLQSRHVQTQIDDDLAPHQPMPVLRKEAPMKSVDHVYEDLSDDDSTQKPTDLVMKTPSSSSAAATLMGIAQASSSSNNPPIVHRSTTSTPVSSKIGINPSMMAQVNAQNAQDKTKQRTTFVTNSPRPNQQSASIINIPSSSSSTPSSSSQPPTLIQTHPMAAPQFLPPGFHPSMIHPQMAALMDPRIAAAAISQQHQQQMSRTPPRQTVADSHKIHELAKSKENEQRQRQQATTPKTPAGAPGATTPQQRQFVPPHLIGGPPGASSIAQQQQQQAHALMQQMQQMQMPRMPQVPTQQDILMMMMSMGVPMAQGGAPGAPGFPGTPQQPPK